MRFIEGWKAIERRRQPRGTEPEWIAVAGHGRAASYVLSRNLVHGDALKMRTHNDQPITFAEWGYLGRGKFQRRDFRLATLTRSSTFTGEGMLWANRGKHELFTPTKTCAPMTLSELATAALGDTRKEAVS